ncbi:MAG: hypothetical protein K9J42_05265 [Sulfuritalea sp.]|nr:hypothetical protein [Sulfuritalea sp.]
MAVGNRHANKLPVGALMKLAHAAGLFAVSPETRRCETFVNRRMLFLWVFAAFFLILAATVSAMLIRNGLPAMRSPPDLATILSAIWAVTIGLAVFASSRPCTTVTVVTGAGLQIRWRYPFRIIEREIGFDEASLARLVASWAGDGVPYFYARIELSGGGRVNLAEGPDRDACVAACNRFNTALVENLAIPPGSA